MHVDSISADTDDGKYVSALFTLMFIYEIADVIVEY